MMAFTGIPAAALDFYEDLENDNSKAFWAAHKHVYDEAVKAPIEALATELATRWGEFTMFRPYRDVRFSKDKTPYKTHQGVWFGETSVYFHVSAAGLWLAGGYWQSSTPQVQRLRRAVDDDVAGPLLAKAVAGVRRKGWQVRGEQLVRVPAGYDKEHPRAELLRHKTLTAGKEVGFPDWLHAAAARTEIAKQWRALAPLTSWLDTHVGHD
ncbi:TIGR02453 family protein [Jatrophihabitans endophyticus]|uniref:TIGR02453 family protein n=1 Tax=Jatrophihabitans endophyticus TaxID=1206085 RepID=A0A1M5MJS8_9ACTN|nr:DUF2461 domain-containing protein [Jatrophihabitans endophyticus]SHG77169.1 TIGR02453 family protein [Jatrophihabitans endophyticus]